MKLNLTLRPSKQFQYFIGFVHLGAMLCVLLISISLLIKIVLIFFCFISLLTIMWKYALLQHHQSISNVLVDGYDNWQLINKNGEKFVGELMGDSLLTNFLIILNFRSIDINKKCSVVIFKDSLSQRAFRELCRFLVTS